VTDNQAVLELTDVTKRYEGAGPDGPPVLDGVSLRVEAGESLAVTGPSGSGKSTLLNIIGTLDRPTSGRVALGGRDLADLDERALAALRATEIGFVFQLHHLLPQCTVMENVLVPTLAAGGEDVAGRAMSLLDRVGLADRAGDLPGRLSGGERQRVAVVRALVNAPKLLLADEPTGALDRASAGGLGDLLCELNGEQGVTLIVVTHAESLAGRMGRALDLRDGSLAPRPPA
jgi:ABC-type lipoprotein export system ATPase subunit